MILVPDNLAYFSTVSFVANDVTGTLALEESGVQGDLPVSAVAASVARKMNLSVDTPWALRDDESRLLEDNEPIGRQLRKKTGQELTLTPKTHLG